MTPDEAKDLVALMTACRENVEDLQSKVDDAKARLNRLTELVKKELRHG